MSKLVVRSYGTSADGFGAGPNQDLENPMGVGGMALHQWFMHTQSFQDMIGSGKSGTTGADNQFASKGFENIGAWILGRNMFGPVRGPWPNEDWKGWWGDTPPYHVPIFVLTHHARKPLEMKGGTTFYFMTDGIESALKQAKEAARGKDIRVGGGASTIRQYLQARLLDELHLAVNPLFMGRGENLFAGIDLPALGYEVKSSTPGEKATHLMIGKKA